MAAMNYKRRCHSMFHAPECSRQYVKLCESWVWNCLSQRLLQRGDGAGIYLSPGVLVQPLLMSLSQERMSSRHRHIHEKYRLAPRCFMAGRHIIIDENMSSKHVNIPWIFSWKQLNSVRILIKPKSSSFRMLVSSWSGFMRWSSMRPWSAGTA